MNYIAVDWGSTNFRAIRVANGKAVKSVSYPAGVAQYDQSELRSVLAQYVTKLDEQYSDSIPILMCGMIGSNLGIQDVGYHSLPTSLITLQAKGVKVETPLSNPVYIQKGIADRTYYDVCRGEELQILGATKLVQANRYISVGTHSKWVSLSEDLQEVVDLCTVMTGELYKLLMQDSLIGRGLPEQESSKAAFMGGVNVTIDNKKNGGDIIVELFKCRSRYVLGQLDKRWCSSFVSGLLIAHEVLTMHKEGDDLCIIGSDVLLDSYSMVCDVLDIKYQTLKSDDCVVTGFNGVCCHD